MAKSAFYKLGVVMLILVALYIGSALIMPLVLASFFAILVFPIFEFVKNKIKSKSLGIIAAVGTIVIAFSLITTALTWQLALVNSDSDKVQAQLETKISSLKSYFRDTYNVSNERLESASTSIKNNLFDFGKSFLGSFTSVLGTGALVLIYTILFLMLKSRLITFLLKISSKDEEETRELIAKSGTIVRRYFIGKLLIMSILATTYIIAFSIMGIEYGIMLGLITALLTIIPYIGNILGAVLVLGFILISGGDYTTMLIILGIMGGLQVIESYVLEPIIVGDRIGLNPFAVILGVVALGAFWGLLGSIVALPILGVLKIWFDSYTPLQPYAYLMDDGSNGE